MCFFFTWTKSKSICILWHMAVGWIASNVITTIYQWVQEILFHRWKISISLYHTPTRRCSSIFQMVLIRELCSKTCLSRMFLSKTFKRAICYKFIAACEIVYTFVRTQRESGSTLTLLVMFVSKSLYRRNIVELNICVCIFKVCACTTNLENTAVVVMILL